MTGIGYTADQLRLLLGAGPHHLVRPTQPPSMNIEVGLETLPLRPAHPTYPRIDVITVTAELGIVTAQVHTGCYASDPLPAPRRDQWFPIELPIATITIPPSITTITPNLIRETGQATR